MTSKNKPIQTPGRPPGLKMRVQEAKVWLGLMRALGAIPTPIPFGELYSALQQGVVDGQENPIVTIVSMKFYEVQKQVGPDRAHLHGPAGDGQQEVVGHAEARAADRSSPTR